MKRLMLSTTLAALCAVSMAYATTAATATTPKQAPKAAANLGVVAIDSQVILRDSKEGKPVYAEMQREIMTFQEQVQKTQQELMAFQESIAKQSKMLSKEALAEKTEELLQRKKEAERMIGDKEETVRRNVQRKQEQLRELGSRQMEVVDTWFTKEGYTVLIDKGAPGVLCVNNAIDKTPQVLALIDEAHEKMNKATQTLLAQADKATTPKEVTTKKGA